MRKTGLLLLGIVLTAPPAGAQTPLIAVAPPQPTVFGPRTVVPVLVACTDVPVTAPTSSALHVLAPHAPHSNELSYRDQVVVLSGGTPQGLQPGQRYFTRRYEPVSYRDGLDASGTYGVIRTTGWLTVIAADEHSALARIEYACTAVAVGDYLEPYVEPSLPVTVAPVAPHDFSEFGQVLLGRDGRRSFGAGDLLSIDRGSANGVTAGARVAFYRDRRNGTPLVELGTGVVLDVTDGTSKVVLDRAADAVAVGDYVVFQRP